MPDAQRMPALLTVTTPSQGSTQSSPSFQTYLMPQDIPGLHAWHSPEEEVQVAAADGCVGHTQQDITLQVEAGSNHQGSLSGARFISLFRHHDG